MKIAFFTDTYLPVHDGVAHVVADIAHTLSQAGHQVTVFTVRSRGMPRETFESDGLKVVRTTSIPLPYYSQYRTALNPWRFLGKELEGTDVVHVHTPGMMGFCGLLAARHRRIPVVGTFHTNIKDMRRSFPQNWFTRSFFRLFWFWNLGIYARCDLVTVPALPAKELLLSGFRKGKGAPVTVLPNGIELRRFHPGITTPNWSARLYANRVNLLTYLGRLTEDKGVHRLLDAWALLSRDLPWIGVIGGDGPEARNLEARIAADPILRTRVRLIGEVAESDKPALLSQSRTFILPSTADTSSVATLEAMASGTTAVVTNRGGPAAIVQHGKTGLLIDPMDPPSIAAALTRILTEEDLPGRLAQNAIAWVRANASIEHTAEEFLRLYEALGCPRDSTVSGRRSVGSVSV